MNPPIPEPMAAIPNTERAPRPEALKYLLSIELILLALYQITSAQNPANQDISWDMRMFNIITLAGWLWVLWCVWNGKNWARRLMICLSAFLFFFLLVSEVLPITIGLFDKAAAAVIYGEMRAEMTLAERYSLIAYSTFSVVWFFWLQTPAIKAFCLKPIRENRSNSLPN